MKYIQFLATQNEFATVFEVLDDEANLYFHHMKDPFDENNNDYLESIIDFVDSSDYARACVTMMAPAVVVVRV